jgi:hypothetical protein
MNIIAPTYSQMNALFFFHYYNQAAVTSHVYKVMAFCPDCVRVSVFPSIIGILCTVEGF